jgi:transcriptional regulator with XRE-family HTH domain
VPTSVFSPQYQLFLQHFLAARKTKKLSQEFVANKLHKPQSYLSKCQTGERRIDVIELYNYCQAVGISFSDFAKELENDLKQQGSE